MAHFLPEEIQKHGEMLAEGTVQQQELQSCCWGLAAHVERDEHGPHAWLVVPPELAAAEGLREGAGQGSSNFCLAACPIIPPFPCVPTRLVLPGTGIASEFLSPPGDTHPYGFVKPLVFQTFGNKVCSLGYVHLPEGKWMCCVLTLRFNADLSLSFSC